MRPSDKSGEQICRELGALWKAYGSNDAGLDDLGHWLRLNTEHLQRLLAPSHGERTQTEIGRDIANALASSSTADIQPWREALREAASIGMANMIAYAGTPDVLSPHKLKSYRRLSELHAMSDEGSAPSATRQSIPLEDACKIVCWMCREEKPLIGFVHPFGIKDLPKEWQHDLGEAIAGGKLVDKCYGNALRVFAMPIQEAPDPIRGATPDGGGA